MNKEKLYPEILLSDARGIYIPRDFVEQFDLKEWNIDPELKEDLNDPENEFYWENWETILNTAEIIHPENKHKYFLYQDGDLWAIPEGFDFEAEGWQ